MIPPSFNKAVAKRSESILKDIDTYSSRVQMNPILLPEVIDAED